MSRAQLLATAGVGVALAVLPDVTHAAGSANHLDFPFYPQVPGTYTPEDLREILNMLDTMEHFAVSVNASNLSGPIDPKLNPLQLSGQQAAVVKSAARVDFLESLGAHSLVDTFTIGKLTPFTALSLKQAEVVVTIFVAAYMTAAREFAELGQPLLVKWAYQTGATLAEERALARAFMAIQNIPDTDPPDNKAFETDLFMYVRDAYGLMTKMGLFGALPVSLPYPSRETVLALAGPIANKVVQTTPNNATTSIALPGDVIKARL